MIADSHVQRVLNRVSLEMEHFRWEQIRDTFYIFLRTMGNLIFNCGLLAFNSHWMTILYYQKSPVNGH